MARRGSASAEQPSTSLRSAPTVRRSAGPASWPIRRKLTALVALPMVLLIVFIAFAVASSIGAWRKAGNDSDAASVVSSANSAISSMDSELSRAIVRLNNPQVQGSSPATNTTAPGSDPNVTSIEDAQASTDHTLAALNAQVSNVNTQVWSSTIQNQARGLTTVPESLKYARELYQKYLPSNNGGETNSRDTLLVADAYSVAIQPVRDLMSSLALELTANSGGQATKGTAQSLVALTALGQSTSGEMVLVGTALVTNLSTEADVTAATTTVTAIQESLNSEKLLLDQASQYAWLNGSNGALTSKIAAIGATNQQLATYRSQAQARLEATTSGSDAGQWRKRAGEYGEAMRHRLEAINQAVGTAAVDLKDQVDAQQRNDLLRLIALVGLALGSLLLVSLLLSSLARTITGPMRRLRSGAVDAATVRLPAAVRQIEREGPESVVAVPPVLPVEAGVGPETREVAQALDGLTSEAIRLATSQVRLRQSLDEAFVSMSRRSQAMVEKQLAIIDELESTEEDPEQLRNLFRLDHLAARMRRYNDNLLVLAGSAVRTRSTSPVAIADVFRAATSEMEQYERVRLQPLAGASIAGTATGGLIHLLAELLDNAAMYSPPTSPIVLAASYLPDGGLRIEVTDSGVGIPATELNDLNARLASVGSVDTQVPSRMGLFVVSRLAQRGGFAVRLSARAQAAGTVAEVTVPRSLVLGAPTGSIEMPPHSGSAETPRLPAQHSAVATPVGGVNRTSIAPSGSAAVKSAGTSQAPTSPRRGDAPAKPSSPQATPPRPQSKPAPSTGPLMPAAHSGASKPLPSRRPGAALANNPLAGATRPGQTSPPSGSIQRPAARSGAPGRGNGRTSPEADSTFGDTGSWTTAERSRNGAASGIDSARRLAGNSTDSTMPPPPVNPGAPAASPLRDAFAPPPARPPQPPTAPTTAPVGYSLPRRQPGTTGATRMPFSESGQEPSSSTNPFEPIARQSDPKRGSGPAPGHRPGARSLPVRAPGAAGQTQAASAATAVAAAAAARLRPVSTTPNGLFGTAAESATTGGSEPTGSTQFAAPADRTAASATPPPAAKYDSAEALNPAVRFETAPSGSPEGDSPIFDSTRTSAFKGTQPQQLPKRTRTAATPTAPSTGAEPAAAGAPKPGERAYTPIFDSISVWFDGDDSGAASSTAVEAAQVIDLRGTSGSTSTAPEPAVRRPGAGDAAGKPSDLSNNGRAARVPTKAAESTGSTGPATSGGQSRWSSLGDQRWIATNVRASAAPEIAGSTATGLPRRRPGANLLPSAATAAGTPAPAAGSATPPRRTDAESVRGRLGSYQRGLSSARRARHLPPEPDSGGMFRTGAQAGDTSGRQGGES